MLDSIRTSCGFNSGSFIATRASLAGLIMAAAGTPMAIAQSAAGLNALAQDNTAAAATPPAAPTQPAASDTQPTDRAPGMKNEDSRVEVLGESDQLIVDLHVNDEDLANVLELLSIQSQKNIVASKNVTARVTANLYGVTFFEALDAILHINGFGYIQRGNFIYIYTVEELKEIEKQSRQRVTAVVKLNYLTAIDAAEFVKPVLSEGGQIKTNGKTSTFQIPDTGPTGADEFASEAMLVIYDYEENVEEIKKLVTSLDTRPAQVLVEATILQTALTEANAFGVDFSLIGDLNFNDFVLPGGPLGVVDGLIAGESTGYSNGSATSSAKRVAPRDGNGRALTSTPGNTSGPGTFKVGFVGGNDVAVFLRLLDEVTDTTILSNPKILALNRQPARVLVGRKVGYLNTTSTDTSTTQTVQFLDTGTQLYFRPFVTNEGLIRLELKPQVSEAVIRDTRDATGAAVTIPDEITNELVTNVLVRDGQTVVLGGLFRESTTSTRRQVPILGDIPLIGNAFRGNEDDNQRSEIIFMITPNIVNDNILLDQGKRAGETVQRARVGAREGMLPFSRDRMTGELLVEAQRLADEGNTEKANWKVRQALAMNPHQPEAIALRERLTGKKSTTIDRSLLSHIFHGGSQPAPANGVSETKPMPSGSSEINPTPSTDSTPVATNVVPETTPVVEQPSQTTVAEATVVETPVVQTPVTQTEVAQTPVAQTEVAQTPVVETPVAETPVVETAVASAQPVVTTEPSTFAVAEPVGTSVTPVTPDSTEPVATPVATVTSVTTEPVAIASIVPAPIPETSTDVSPEASQRRLSLIDRLFSFFTVSPAISSPQNATAAADDHAATPEAR
jgi:type IV pilus assembly protein PilQ